jgi:hypothetical protein
MDREGVRVAGLETRVETLEGTVAHILERQEVVEPTPLWAARIITSLRENQLDLGRRMGGVEHEVGGLRGQVGGLREEVGGLPGQVGGLRGEVGDLREEVGDLRGEVRGLRREMDEGFAHVDDRFAHVDEEFRELRRGIGQLGVMLTHLIDREG